MGLPVSSGNRSGPGHTRCRCLAAGGVLRGRRLLVYLVAFVFVYTWIPSYASQVFSLPLERAGALTGRFFAGLLVGQLAMFALALRVDVRTLITLAGYAATCVTAGLWLSATLAHFEISVLMLGVLAGGLLKSLIAFGSQVTGFPSSRLMGFYMFCTALGSSISPALGAFIVESAGLRAVLVAVSVGFAATMVLVSVAKLLRSAAGPSPNA